MKTFEVVGVIGFDATYQTFAENLASAKGDDVTIIFNSPGGDVAQGFAMISAMKSYKKQYPNARIITESRGMLASMAPVIAFSKPVDIRRVEDNVTGMIHNPWMMAAGDARTMASVLDRLNAYTENYASSLAECNTKKSKTQIRAMMDAPGDGTWMFGKSLVDNGFADEVIPAGDGPEDQATAFAMAKTEFLRMGDVLKAQKETDARAVAIAEAFVGIQAITPGVPGEKNIPESQGGQEMFKTLAEFKTGEPALYTEFESGVKASAVKEERARVVALGEIKKKYGSKVGAVAELADAAIGDGRTASDIALAVADLVAAAVESAPPVNTGANGTASGETAPVAEADDRPVPRFR